MTATMTTSPAVARINAAALDALALPEHLRDSVLAHTLGLFEGLAGIADHGGDITPGKIADLLDATLANAIGRSLRVGDRVTVDVNDLGGAVTGVVDAIHDSLGASIAIDVSLPGGRIFTQSARFVKPVGR